jgi:predicted Zn-dependent protease with MMP-like domain
MDTLAFQQIAFDALDAIPPKLRAAIQDVQIVIEDRPTGRNARRKGLLLGLYEGIPLTAPDRNYSGKLPDKITLFREHIEAYAQSEEEIPHVIRETVWHEVGHFFGLDHDRIHLMEKRWREKRKPQST